MVSCKHSEHETQAQMSLWLGCRRGESLRISAWGDEKYNNEKRMKNIKGKKRKENRTCAQSETGRRTHLQNETSRRTRVQNETSRRTCEQAEMDRRTREWAEMVDRYMNKQNCYWGSKNECGLHDAK